MGELTPLRVEPAFTAPPHARAPTGNVALWLLDAPGALVQCIEPMKGTATVADWLIGAAYETVDSYFPKRNDLVLVLDLHNMVGRTSAARSILLNSARILGKRFANVYVVPPAAYPLIYRQAFQASLAFARLLGIRVMIAGSSAQLIDRYGWQPLNTVKQVLAATS